MHTSCTQVKNEKNNRKLLKIKTKNVKKWLGQTGLNYGPDFKVSEIKKKFLRKKDQHTSCTLRNAHDLHPSLCKLVKETKERVAKEIDSAQRDADIITRRVCRELLKD